MDITDIDSSWGRSLRDIHVNAWSKRLWD